MYRNLADNVDTISDFFAQISNDANIPREDVQKYHLATSDFAKSIQTDINHYVIRDRINNASFRQKLDPVSKNILRRQNPLELVFEDISTFDAENPIVGSLLREIDIKKKQSGSDFIKSLPSHPGKEFEIKKRLEKLREIKNDNNNNFGNGPPPPTGGTNIDFLNKYGLDKPPPSLPTIEDFIDNGPPPAPPAGGTNISFNNTPFVPPKQNFNITDNPFVLPNIGNNGKIGNDLFGSVAAMADPREKEKIEPKDEIDDFLYELPYTGIPHLELGYKLAGILGTEGEDLFDVNAPPTKKEEEDEILKKVIEEYDIPGMKDTMDVTGEVPESIYLFYGGDSQNFVDALEFIGLSPINREFAAFLLSDLGRQVMTQNKLSIHVESGDTFYDNQNTEENFYSFLLSQQNDEAAYVPKNFSNSNTFGKYVTDFLQFSIDDQEKFDLLAFKNSKYLFYRFNNFVKMYGNSRYKLLHTRKMLDTVGMQKVEEKNNQFLIEKIILGVQFKNAYQKEKKPEILEIIEGNYKVARRVYQYLYLDIADLFLSYVKLMDRYEIQDIEEDMKANGWGTVKKIPEVNDSFRMLNLFQDFYTSTGRLPAFNRLLVVPDGDASENSNKINMKSLYDLFKNTKSHGLVSLPLLGLLLHFFESKKDLCLIKNATTEFYENLSYDFKRIKKIKI